MAVLIQGILPFLGHAAIVKTLRWLVVPFVILFAVMLGFAIPHANLERRQDELAIGRASWRHWPSPSH